MKTLLYILIAFTFIACNNSEPVEQQGTVKPTTKISGKKSAPIEIAFEKINDLQINLKISFNTDAKDISCEIHDYKKGQCHFDQTLLPKDAKKSESVLIPIRLDANHSIENIGVYIHGVFGSTTLGKGQIYSFNKDSKKETNAGIIKEDNGRKVHVIE